jgi:hypothetical protein
LGHSLRPNRSPTPQNQSKSQGFTPMALRSKQAWVLL